MAYAVPKTWAHGDTVSPTDLNKYRDGQNAIHDVTGDQLIIALVGESNEHVAQPSGSESIWENSRLVFMHRYRWLYFASDGEITDLDGNEEPTALNEDEGSEVTLFDLDDVPWLSYGQVYSVTGVTYACEFESA